jgi:hypothetical protein
MNLNGTYYTTDEVAAAPTNATPTGGITIDQVDSDTNWSRVSTTIVDEHKPFFGTNRFHTFDSVVAKSIKQSYTIDGTDYVFKKTPEALKEAQFSVRNAPFTLDHPDSGRVTQTGEVHGFFDSPEYDLVNNELRATLHVPTNDSQAHERLEATGGVSIGFTNTINTDTSESDVDGYQEHILVNHISSVSMGRCSESDGCQIDTDGADSQDSLNLPTRNYDPRNEGSTTTDSQDKTRNFNPTTDTETVHASKLKNIDPR